MSSVPQSGIYRIVCLPTGKFYIGSSSHINKRWSEHKRHLECHKHQNRYLQSAWDKYGGSSFLFEIIEFVMPWSLKMREQYWIDRLKPFGKRGFNIATNTISPQEGRSPTEETRKKLSEAMMGRPKSDETRKKLSIARKGKKPSVATVEAHAVEWVVTNPEGHETTIKNLSLFCRENNLDASNMRSVASGFGFTHRGWKCRHA